MKWQPVPGFEDQYEVSSQGEVRTKPRILKPYRNPHGYDTVVIGGKTVPIHRLVAQAFLPNPLLKKIVHHKNKKRHDNRVSNLEWATHGENNQSAWNSGRVAYNKKPVYAWPTEACVGSLTHMRTYESAAQAAEINKVSKTTIARAARTKGYAAGKWGWTYDKP